MSVMLFGGEHAATSRTAMRAFGPANDNGPRDPVQTVTVRRTLEKSGVPIKIKVPVTEFVRRRRVELRFPRMAC